MVTRARKSKQHKAAPEKRARAKTTALKSPGPMDFKRGDRLMRKLLDENLEWFKEMAKR